jgi:hypothetical protein
LFFHAVQSILKEELPFAFLLIGMGGGPKVIPSFKLLFVSDKTPLKAHFARLAAMPGHTRLVSCHGTVITSDPARLVEARRDERVEPRDREPR